MTSQNPLAFVKNLFRIIAAGPEVPPPLKGNPLLRTILNRRSVRKFSRESIPDTVLQAVLEAGRLAPSAVNFQTWSFFVFTPRSWRAAFGRPLPCSGVRAIMVMADLHRGRKALSVIPPRPLVEYTLGVTNAAMAAMSMNMAAEALGVASVMLTETGRSGYLDAKYLKERLSLPNGVFPLLTLVLGYPRSGPPVLPPKLPLHHICHTGKYRDRGPKVMNDWLAQMSAGFKADHPLSSFDAQLRLYLSKIDRVEQELQDLIFYGRGEDAERRTPDDAHRRKSSNSS